VIAIALGLAALLTAGSVYLNEREEHKATVDFHNATHLLIDSGEAGTTTPAGRRLADASDRQFVLAEDQQERATRFTLIEVILACVLFLLGVAGVAKQERVQRGALAAAGISFATAVVLLATV